MNSNASLNRVPPIIGLYWVIKIASTTLGETGADMVSMTYNVGYGATILLFMGLLGLFLSLKLMIKRYEPILYWLTFTTTAIAGTALCDFIDRTLGLGYATGSFILILVLLIVLWGWYLREKNLRVETITTSSAELFYWLAFLVANTLGTAAGDFLADDMGMGFGHSAVLISALLIAITLVHFTTNVSKVLLFWLAFVLTRPFGATFGDLLTKTHEKGGLDLGTVGASLFFVNLLILAIYHEIRRGRRV